VSATKQASTEKHVVLEGHIVSRTDSVVDR